MRAWADGSGGVEVGDVRLAVAQPTTGESVVRLAIRPERVRIEAQGEAGENRVPVRIERFVYLGSTTQVFVVLPGGDRLQALVANSEDVEEYDVGTEVTAYLPPDALRVLTDEEEAGR
jgi:ABC-type Fe3+/spermidine/putrescine transport system ATPase subunit